MTTNYLLTCSCCRRPISRCEWMDLPLVGAQVALPEDPFELQLRNCSCGSTLGVEVPRGATHVCREMVEIAGRLAMHARWHEGVLPYLRETWVTRARERSRDAAPLVEMPLYLEVP